MLVPTKEQLKARSKHLAKLLQEKYNVKVSHGHCLDIVSQLEGYKDWNTASAVSPSDDSSQKPDPAVQYTPWLEALTKGYYLSVEQPYLKETFHAGGATAQRSSEQGITSMEFTPRIDEETRRVVLTLPLLTSSLPNKAVIEMHKQQYLKKEQEFAKKLGGRAEDLSKK